MIELLAQVTGLHKGRPFAAGIVLQRDKVVVAAPIVRRHLMGRTRDEVRRICVEKGWRVSVVHEVSRPDTT